MPKLYILCGIPGCGKTYFAKNFIKEFARQNIQYVSRDEIRFSIIKDDEDYFSHENEVFKIFSDSIIQMLREGHDVIADATHLNYASRKKLISTIDSSYKDYQIYFMVFFTELDVCLRRNHNRTGRARVPDEVMFRMSKNFEIPTFSQYENDDRIRFILHIKN